MSQRNDQLLLQQKEIIVVRKWLRISEKCFASRVQQIDYDESINEQKAAEEKKRAAEVEIQEFLKSQITEKQERDRKEESDFATYNIELEKAAKAYWAYQNTKEAKLRESEPGLQSYDFQSLVEGVADDHCNQQIGEVKFSKYLKKGNGKKCYTYKLS